MGVQQFRTFEKVQVRFGLKSVNQYFLEQYLDSPLVIVKFMHFSTLQVYGPKFSNQYSSVRFSLSISDSQRTSGIQGTIDKYNL